MAEDPKNPFSGILGKRGGRIPEPAGGNVTTFRDTAAGRTRRAMREEAKAEADVKRRQKELSKEQDRMGLGPRGSERLRDKHFPSMTKAEANVPRGKQAKGGHTSGVRSRRKSGLMGPGDLYGRRRPPGANDNRTGGKF